MNAPVAMETYFSFSEKYAFCDSSLVKALYFKDSLTIRDLYGLGGPSNLFIYL